MRAAKKRDLSGLSFFICPSGRVASRVVHTVAAGHLAPDSFSLGSGMATYKRVPLSVSIRCALCTVYCALYRPLFPAPFACPASWSQAATAKKVPPTVSAAAAFTAMRYSLHSQNKSRLVFAYHLLSAVSASKSRDSAVGSICCRQRWAVSSCQSAFCTVTSRSWLCHTNSCSCCRLSDRRVSVLPA